MPNEQMPSPWEALERFTAAVNGIHKAAERLRVVIARDAAADDLATLRNRINLALTHLRAELERPGARDTRHVREAYRLLGGVVAGEEG